MLRVITNVHYNWTPRSRTELDTAQAVSTQLECKMALSSKTTPVDSVQLVDERAVIGPALHRIQELLSALHRLPPGILGKIFDYFVMPRTGKSPDSRKETLLLCSISKHWRAVAISTPSLWTSLELFIGPGWTPAFDTTCLAHSYPLPIDIHLHYTDYFPPALDTALRLISRNLRRIRYLCLDLRHPWDGEFRTRPAHKFPAPQGYAPASQLIMADISLPQKSIAWEWISAVVGNAPNLTRFAFFGAPVPNACWAQLDSLSLGCVTLSESIRVLSHAPRLRNCDFVITASQETRSQRPFLVHSLKCLLLESDGTPPGRDNVTRLLDFVTLPRLISLAIVGGRGPWHQPTVMSFLDRSACTLRRLNLVETRSVSDLQICQIMRHPSAQSLTSLKLENCAGAVTHNLVRDLLVRDMLLIGVGGPPTFISIPALREIYLSPVLCHGGTGTLVAKLDDKGVYALRILEGIPDMSATFTSDIPDVDEQ